MERVNPPTNLSLPRVNQKTYTRIKICTSRIDRIPNAAIDTHQNIYFIVII